MNASDQFQAIVIGSGQGGNPLCMELARARVAYLAGRGADYGVHTGNIRINMERVRKRKRDIVDAFRARNEEGLGHTANLELIFGEASFTGAQSVLVRLRDGGQRVLTGERIFINAGARPAVPAIEGLKDVPFLDSTSIMELGE